MPARKAQNWRDLQDRDTRLLGSLSRLFCPLRAVALPLFSAGTRPFPILLRGDLHENEFRMDVGAGIGGDNATSAKGLRAGRRRAAPAARVYLVATWKRGEERLILPLPFCDIVGHSVWEV